MKNGKMKAGKIKRSGLNKTLMALPFVILVFFMAYVPLMGWGLAFFRYKPGFDFTNLQFTGLKYFKLIVENWKDSKNAITNTMVMGGLYIIMMPIPMIFSILLTECRFGRLRKTIQTTITLPHFVSWVIVYSLSFALFSNSGVVYEIMDQLGIERQGMSIMSRPNSAWIFMAVLYLWKSLGWNTIVYMASIASIDGALYEAAALDGANRFQLIWNVTIPSIMPTFIVLLLLQVGNFLNVGFDQYYAFTNPAIASKLEVIDMYSYRLAIGNGDYSFGLAVSMLKSVISKAIIYGVNAFAKKVRGESII